MSFTSGGWTASALNADGRAHYYEPNTADSLCGYVWLAPSVRSTIADAPERQACDTCSKKLAQRIGAVA